MTLTASTQTLQLYFDPRHALDPEKNKRNFASLYFEYFKNQDSGRSFVKPGSILVKAQADFAGQRGNLSQAYLQVSQTLRFWPAKVFLNLGYTGGLGITEPKEYSYYINNAYSVGLSYPFRWRSAYFAAVMNYKYTPYARASHDVSSTLYWWKGILNYKVELSGDCSLWTENNNHGDEATKDLSGKRFYCFAEPQAWYNLSKSFGAGVKVNVFYHVLTAEHKLLAYPALGVRWKL